MAARFLGLSPEDFSNVDSISECKALITFAGFEYDKDVLVADEFVRKRDFLSELFADDSKQAEIVLEEEKSEVKSVLSTATDAVILRGWKNVENISSRLIDTYDDSLVLECLINKEEGIYEEREFRSSLFSGYDLSIGSLFLLRIFERQNEIRMEIHNDPELTLKDDFPPSNFSEKFRNSRLFIKK